MMVKYGLFVHVYARSVVCCVMVLFLSSCLDQESSTKIIEKELDYSVNTSDIPTDTVDFKDPRVSYVNGIYYLDNKEYSGIVFKVLKGYNLKTYSSVLNGMLHGKYRSFYENGKPYEVRQYRANKAVGKQYGYWEDTGNLKFEYNYYNQKKEGVQKSWYSNGEPYYEYNYKDDRQVGMQKAWRKNGSLFRNFVVKNGVRYGLQKSVSCYGLANEEVIKSSNGDETL
ncbi:hypothetical protein V5097_09690 [Arenibacter palladensis]|uniref:toxin-antitoxin system YwqK family antitoxin n=1 Tax=Arenibacter palladensis TaxID=237373 RepID=UPI002FCEE586